MLNSQYICITRFNACAKSINDFYFSKIICSYQDFLWLEILSKYYMRSLAPYHFGFHKRFSFHNILWIICDFQLTILALSSVCLWKMKICILSSLELYLISSIFTLSIKAVFMLLVFSSVLFGSHHFILLALDIFPFYYIPLLQVIIMVLHSVWVISLFLLI